MQQVPNEDCLPNDAVQIGSVPIYLSNTSPGYVWVTCLGSMIRVKVREESESQLVKAEAVRFWNSDGHGRYELQRDSQSELPPAEYMNGTQHDISITSTPDAEMQSVHRVLRVLGSEPCESGQQEEEPVSVKTIYGHRHTLPMKNVATQDASSWATLQKLPDVDTINEVLKKLALSGKKVGKGVPA